MKKFAVLFVFIAFFVVSCGGGESGSNDQQGDEAETENETEKGEEESAEDAEQNDSDADEVKELLYPEVTATSNKNGDIAQNITIYDDLDVEHHLAEWYKPNNPESRLIWLIFTTYDCAPCHILKDDLLEINKAEYRERGFKIILVFNGMLDGPQPELEPDKLANYKDMFLSEYPDTGRFEVYGYLKKEEQRVFKKFTSAAGSIMGGGAYPTWAFIDASTMEIVEWGEGWGTDMVKGTCDNIEMLLDEL
ncbi:hypothetical protein J6Z19_01395 [bacterium]|nr:hypothetical protein [bacterium]